MSKKIIALRYDNFTIEAHRDFVATAVLSHARSAAGAPLPAVAANDIPRLGEYWAGQGGLYAGLTLGEDGNTYHLIRAVDDLSEGIAWGEYDKKLDGCENKWDGLANTRAMAAAGNEAAIKTLALVIDSHQDFYIPAQREAMLQYINAPAASKKELYWTSTQFSPPSTPGTRASTMAAATSSSRTTRFACARSADSLPIRPFNH